MLRGFCFRSLIKYVLLTTLVAAAIAGATALSFADSAQTGGAGADVEPAEAEEAHEKTYERMIAHGGGSVEGYETSSSVDAVKLAIKNGFRMIELDMEFSADNKIIMLHDWDRTMETYLGRKYDRKLTLSEFNNQLICGHFEPLTFDKLTKLLDENPQVRIVTDTKGDNIKLLTAIAENYPAYIKQMVPQIYDYSEFETAKALGYEDIIFTLYTQSTIDKQELLEFVRENDIYAVTMPVNYWVKGVCGFLAKGGVKVYVHPVYTVEEAEKKFAEGAYGVYSSTLIPSELEGYAEEFYLLQKNEEGSMVKLTDATFGMNGIRNIKIHGNTHYKAFKYKLDGMLLEDRLAELEDSVSEVHRLEIEMWDITKGYISPDDEPMYVMTYLLTKNEGQVRILDEKYAYRPKQLREAPSFDAVMSKASEAKNFTAADKELIELLSGSFIAKAGSYYYYNNEKSGIFSVENELLYAQKSLKNSALVPLSEAAAKLGADRVRMDKQKYVYINMAGRQLISQVNSGFARMNGSNVRIGESIVIYRDKAMAAGEVLGLISGRKYIEGNEILIILPEKCSVTASEREKLIEYAELLYKQTE
ncbi:MAG: glycerophosphodiester phosphodiesterase family protein [Anaerovoracaceae bacterium]